jgi:hypothetical protein
MNIIRMNINHKSRMVYGSILLVVLVILYYYYTRIYEGLSFKPSIKSKIMASRSQPPPPPKTAAEIKAEQEEKEKQAELKKQEEMTNQIKQIKKSYINFYELLSDENKGEINQVYNHFIENVVKDDYPPFK